MEYEEYLKEVIRLVKEKIGQEKWFRGVNITDTKDYFEAGTPVAKAAESATMLTQYWDGPSMF